MFSKISTNYWLFSIIVDSMRYHIDKSNKEDIRYLDMAKMFLRDMMSWVKALLNKFNKEHKPKCPPNATASLSDEVKDELWMTVMDVNTTIGMIFYRMLAL